MGSYLHPRLLVKVGDIELLARCVWQLLVVLLKDLVESHVV